MKDKIIKIAESIWAFVQAVLALTVLAFIFSVILFLIISAVFGAVWSFDYLFLGGAIFG